MLNHQRKAIFFRQKNRVMFFSGRANKGNYGGSKRGNDDEDLLAKLAAERTNRAKAKLLEKAVLVTQSAVRAQKALRAARQDLRAHFDANVAAALTSGDKSNFSALRLAHEFAFFAGRDASLLDADVKRLVLVAALFRDRTDVPFSLIRPVVTLLAVQVLPLPVAGGACRLLLQASSSSGKPWKNVEDVFSKLAVCMQRYPSLQTMLVAVAGCPIRVAPLSQQPLLRSLFVRCVMVVPNILSRLPLQMLPAVVAAIGGVEGLPADQSLAVVGNLAFLLSNGVLQDSVISLLGASLPSVVELIFPRRKRLRADAPSSDSDVDDEDDRVRVPVNASQAISAVQDQLKMLMTTKIARQLLGMSSNVAGVCVLYALLMDYASAQDCDNVYNVAFQSPEGMNEALGLVVTQGLSFCAPVLKVLWIMISGDERCVQSIVTGSFAYSWLPSVFRVFCELYCRFFRTFWMFFFFFFFFCFVLVLVCFILACAGCWRCRRMKRLLLVL
jgi:hypothetical protein